MGQELEEKIKAMDEKIDAIYVSVEKTRKYFLIIIWLTVIMFVLPLIGMFFVAPSFLDTYLGSMDGLL